MGNPLVRYMLGVGIALGLIATGIVITSASLHGQLRSPQALDKIDLCRVDANSAACLQSQITQLKAQVDALQEQVNRLQQTTAAVSSIGNPQSGKADGYDDIWSAIQRLTNEVKALEKR